VAAVRKKESKLVIQIGQENGGQKLNCKILPPNIRDMFNGSLMLSMFALTRNHENKFTDALFYKCVSHLNILHNDTSEQEILDLQ
jgi:hypothetical protein